MSKRRGVTPALEHAVRVFLAGRNLAALGEELFLTTASKIATRDELSKLEREILRRARQLEGVLVKATPQSGANVVDIRGQLRRRSISKALGNSPRPPPRAA